MKKIMTLLLLGLAALSPAQTQVTAYRYLLLEHFTNTRCSICPARNAVLQSTLADHPGRVHHISYHPSVPYSNCLIYQSNPAQNENRRNLYGVSFTPQARLWGANHMTSPILLPATTLADSSGQNAALRVRVEEQTVGARGVSIRVQTLAEVPAGDLRLFAAVVEKNYPYAAPNGEANHHNVFRLMLPQINGESFTPAAGGGEVVFNYPYPLDPAWNAAEVYVLAWVQDMDTRRVYNSGTRFDLQATLSQSGNVATVYAQGGIPPYSYLWSTGVTTASASDLPPGMHTVTVTDQAGVYFTEVLTVEGSVSVKPELLERLITVYPNPARDRLHVDLNGLEFREAKLALHDLQGRQALPAQSLQKGETETAFDLSELPKGIYFLRITVDERRMEKKITKGD